MMQKILLSRAKWYLPLVLGALATVIGLNVSISRAVLIESNRAAAQATQISSPIMIDYELAGLAVENRTLYLDLEMQKAQQHVAFEQQKYIQQLQDLSAKNAALLKFRKDLYAAILLSLRIVSGSLGIGLIIASIFGGLGLSRYLTARAQANDSMTSSEKKVVKEKRPSVSAGQSRKNLLDRSPATDRRGTLADIRSSIPVWTRKAGDISPRKYPRAE